jgi:hypothetical protein
VRPNLRGVLRQPGASLQVDRSTAPGVALLNEWRYVLQIQ